MKQKIPLSLILLMLCTTAEVSAEQVLHLPARAFSEYFTDNLREDVRESNENQVVLNWVARGLMDGVKGMLRTLGSGLLFAGDYSRMPKTNNWVLCLQVSS